MTLRLAFALLGVCLVLAGFAWLAYRTLRGYRILSLIKDPPVALILTGVLLCFVLLLFSIFSVLSLPKLP
jgi:hypothetical protein